MILREKVNQSFFLQRINGGNPNKPAPGDLETRFYPRDGSRIYEIKAHLPEGGWQIKPSACRI